MHTNTGRGKGIMCNKCIDEWTHPHCTWLWLIELNVHDKYSQFMTHFFSQWDYEQCWHFVRMLVAPFLLFLILHICLLSMGRHFSSRRNQDEDKGKYLIKSLLSVSNTWFPQRSSLTPPPTVPYKQEDCCNLPCLSTLTSSNTEIRYKIKLTKRR